MNIFITFALCASIAAAAPVSVPKVQASLAGITTYVGAITLNDTAGYKVTAPFGMALDGTCSKDTYTDKASCEDASNCGIGGSDACNYVWTGAGFSGSFEAKTNDNPSCDGLKTITVTGSFKFNLPTALTNAINTLSTALGKTLVPDISTLSNGFSITQEIDVSSLTADIDIPLSDKVGADKQKILNLLGTDITFRIAISELRLFKKGVEIPLYIVVEVVKKSIMKLPAESCGARKANICGAACDALDAVCLSCDVLCAAAGSAIDAVIAGTNNAAIFEQTYNIAKLLDDVAKDQSVDTKGIVRDCAAATSKKCFGIGTADACPVAEAELKSGAGKYQLNVLSFAVVALIAYLQM